MWTRTVMVVAAHAPPPLAFALLIQLRRTRCPPRRPPDLTIPSLDATGTGDVGTYRIRLRAQRIMRVASNHVGTMATLTSGCSTKLNAGVATPMEPMVKHPVPMSALLIQRISGLGKIASTTLPRCNICSLVVGKMIPQPGTCLIPLEVENLTFNVSKNAMTLAMTSLGCSIQGSVGAVTHLAATDQKNVSTIVLLVQLILEITGIVFMALMRLTLTRILFKITCLFLES